VASVRYRIGRAHTQQGVLFAAPFSRHALWARLYSVSGFTGGPCFALSGQSCVSRNYCYTVANWNCTALHRADGFPGRPRGDLCHIRVYHLGSSSRRKQEECAGSNGGIGSWAVAPPWRIFTVGSPSGITFSQIPHTTLIVCAGAGGPGTGDDFPSQDTPRFAPASGKGRRETRRQGSFTTTAPRPGRIFRSDSLLRGLLHGFVSE
jgi:hypothetical protein